MTTTCLASRFLSEDTISEAGGTSNLTATLSTASGRDVTVGLVMQGTAGSKDFTVGGNEIDVSEILTERTSYQTIHSLVMQMMEHQMRITEQ